MNDEALQALRKNRAAPEPGEPPAFIMTSDSAERKDIPLARGLLDYFPDALIEVARLSQVGNDKHNPGEELHHARGKSTDHADCILRHLVERGYVDTDNVLHSVKTAWRALALAQEELEARGAQLARGARVETGAVTEVISVIGRLDPGHLPEPGEGMGG